LKLYKTHSCPVVLILKTVPIPSRFSVPGRRLGFAFLDQNFYRNIYNYGKFTESDLTALNGMLYGTAEYGAAASRNSV
jgi:hypothetical protein